MSVLSYRPWDIWLNSTYFDNGKMYHGYFECTILNALMVPQTLQFIAEKYEIRNGRFQQITIPPMDILKRSISTVEGNLCIKLYDELITSKCPKDIIKKVLLFLESLSMCVDCSLICHKIRFISNDYGKLLVANRHPIGRGIGFEIEERGKASEKLNKDFDFYLDESDPNLVVGKRHYLAGMQLLALEDQITGLVDAAFMQFYQGCEALCRDPSGSLKGSQKYIAKLSEPDVRELQIIAHQIWMARNKYFGHGDVQYNLNANINQNNAQSVAKQVLVARYLCRRLIDANAPSGFFMEREMSFHFRDSYNKFSGEIRLLEREFRVDIDNRISKIFDSSGNEVEEYTIQ